MKFRIDIDPLLAEKMEHRRIAEADVREVVARLEETGCKLLDKQTGLYTGHHQLGNLTCWVSYRIERGYITVVNAYIHRMRIVEQEQTGGGHSGQTDH